jgi:hypothetical protein
MKQFAAFVLCLFFLSAVGFAQDQPAKDQQQAGPRCPRQACSAALKDYKGPAKACHASYAQLEGQSNEVWLVAIDTGSGTEYRGVDAKTGEVLPKVDSAKAKRCGPRPFHCPDWVYQPCPE